MEQFSLDKWLQDKSRKVTTRYGDREVRIICTDRKDKRPIVALMADMDDGSEYITSHSINGWIDDEEKYPDKRDLFFADEDEELTEFEKEVEMMMVSFSNGNLSSDVRKEMPKQKLHNYAHRLLDFARKELEKEITKEVEQKAINHTYAYQNGYENCKYDALKDLPKWKKITEEKQNYLAYGYLSHDRYYLSIQELKDKLPKEE